MINDLINRNALFVINHSGGKDSQAMMAIMSTIGPASQVLVIHAELPGVDWDGTWDHIVDTTQGYELLHCVATKTFFDMVGHRGMWPSPKYRQCTSDLKRGPIEREIRRHLRANPQHGGLVVNCVGLRAEESSRRAKAVTLKRNERCSKAGREWYEFLPIHDLLEPQVFAVIAAAGQKPHWAYGEGMSRLSCCFCIMSNRSDMAVAARLNPDLYAKYVQTERDLDHTFLMPVRGKARAFLEDVTGISAKLATT